MSKTKNTGSDWDHVPDAEPDKPQVGMVLEARSHPVNANINGWNYQQIIRRTKAGREAVRQGNPHTFLMRLANVHQDLPPEMAYPPRPQSYRDR